MAPDTFPAVQSKRQVAGMAVQSFAV